MAKQKRNSEGQTMPWSNILTMMDLRDQTKHKNRVPLKQRKLIEEMAEEEVKNMVIEELYGG